MGGHWIFNVPVRVLATASRTSRVSIAFYVPMFCLSNTSTELQTLGTIQNIYVSVLRLAAYSSEELTSSPLVSLESSQHLSERRNTASCINFLKPNLLPHYNPFQTAIPDLATSFRAKTIRMTNPFRQTKFHLEFRNWFLFCVQL